MSAADSLDLPDRLANPASDVIAYRKQAGASGTFAAAVEFCGRNSRRCSRKQAAAERRGSAHTDQGITE
jgi:hypothetical protein